VAVSVADHVPAGLDPDNAVCLRHAADARTLTGLTWSHRQLRHNPGYQARMAIASGPSPRGVQHAVVMLDGEIVWDPHPSRDGILRVTDIWEFTPGNPADSAFLLCLDNAAYMYAELGIPLP
jgi:hypothetical protein